MGRTDGFAEGFLAAHREFYDLIKDATDEQWRARGLNHPEIRRGDEDEGRPVGVIAHHVGNGYRNNRARCQAWIRGEDPAPPSDEANTRHAAENPDPDHQATLRFLTEEAASMEAFIRGLSEAELDAAGRFATGPMTVAESVGRILPFHIRWHLGSIKATWEALATASPPPGGLKI